jgi:peptidoglycan/LPS O-acetylase OafA/YrhL
MSRQCLSTAIPRETKIAESLPDSSPSKVGQPSRFYRPELDALRFFAFLAVFLFHALNDSPSSKLASMHWVAIAESIFQESCRFGLCLFFFLSSYLITALLQLEKLRTGTVNLRSFYIRRVLRIWPLYFAYLLLICLLHKTAPEFSVNTVQIALMLVFSGNWYFVWHGFPASVINHLWSISVEEQFYLLFPSVSRQASNSALKLICFVLSVLALATSFVLVRFGTPEYGVWANSFVEALFFAAGALFSTRNSLSTPNKSLTRALVSTFSGFTLWLTAGFIWRLPAAPTTAHAVAVAASYLVVAIGCTLILWGFLHMPLYLLPKTVIYLGRISYGLYVFHELMMYLTRRFFSRYVHVPGSALLVELLLTIGVATLSYEYFEKPFLRLKGRFEVIHSRAV